MSGSHRLKTSLQRLRRPDPTPADLRPCTPFEVAVAEQLKAMREDLDQLQARLWWLFALIIGAAVANLIAALVGG